MKYFLLSASFLFLISCGNRAIKDSKIGTEKKESASSNKISFKIREDEINTSGWNISRFEMGHKIGLNITSNMHEDKRTVAFNINGDRPGTYKLSGGSREEGTAYGSYKPDYSDIMNSYGFTEGELTITGIDTVSGVINATFFGTAKKGNEVINVLDGKIINGRLTPGVMKYD
jgi:hypothetical protein